MSLNISTYQKAQNSKHSTRPQDSSGVHGQDGIPGKEMEDMISSIIDLKSDLACGFLPVC